MRSSGPPAGSSTATASEPTSSIPVATGPVSHSQVPVRPERRDLGYRTRSAASVKLVILQSQVTYQVAKPSFEFP
jgi:hypothetical protein